MANPPRQYLLRPLFVVSVLIILLLLKLNARDTYARRKRKPGKKASNLTKQRGQKLHKLSRRLRHQITMCGLHFKQGRIQDGRKELHNLFSPKVKHLHPLIANEVFPHAIQQHHSGKIHIALELYTFLLKYVKDNTTSANIYANLGLAERDYGNRDKAMKYWKKGLEADPHHGNILRMTGQTYHEMKYLTSARTIYLKIIDHESMKNQENKNYKPDPSVLGNLCDLERQLGNMERAHEYCLKALEINPHTHRARSSLGAILLQKSKEVTLKKIRRELLKEAKKHLGEAITYAPHLENAWTNYGLTMEELEEFDTALKSYHKAKLLSPTNPVVYHNLARHHLMQGNMIEASEYYRGELENRLKRSTRKCVDSETHKLKDWTIVKHAWRDVDMIDILSTNKREITLLDLDSSNMQRNQLDVLHTDLDSDDTYISQDTITFNKTKWHGVAKINDVYMESRHGILYSTKQCKVYLGGHRYMSGVRKMGLSGLHSFDNHDASTKDGIRSQSLSNRTIILKTKDLERNEKIEYANLVTFNSNNYFHFMVETLSRLVLFKNYFENEGDSEQYDDTQLPNLKVKYLVNAGKPFVHSALTLLNLNLETDVVMYHGNDPGRRYFIQDLYLADWFTSDDNTLDDQYVSPTHLFLPPPNLVRKQLREYILFNEAILSKWKESGEDNNNDRRLHLYVGRKLPLKTRRVIGERRLIANMKSFIEETKKHDVHGRPPIMGSFHLVNGSAMPLTEQISLFNKASIVIGPHGAGLTNIMFMKAGAVVMEFPVRHAKLLYFKFLALASQLHYYEIKEVFTYADLDYEITDHSIEAVKSYIYSGNVLLNNRGHIPRRPIEL